jgi:hypothetical protein
MMRAHSVFAGLIIVPALAIAACGGGSPEPQTSESMTPAAAPMPEPPPPAEPPPASTTAPEPAAEAPPPAPARKPAKDVVTNRGAVFMLSFADSDIKQAKTEECAKKAKNDEKKTEECLTKAEGEAANEGVRFEQDDKGNWWWVAFVKKGDKETINNKVQFKIKSEAEDKLTLSTEGKDQGKKPLKALPAELVIEVPDERTVVITDPVRGRLVYKLS